MDHVLIPGAGGRAWYWHLVAPRLRARGHRAIPVELPADDDTKGLPDYAQAVLDAVGTAGDDVVVVAASLGAFTAPLVVEPLRATAVVLVNPMIPRPGETPGAWWGDTGAVEARSVHASHLGLPTEFDPRIHLLHDVPPDVLATSTPKGEQSRRPFRDACTFSAWPAATTVISARDDRFFPLEFQQQLARDRLGIEPVVIAGGHLVALSQPDDLAAAILAATATPQVS
jgi:pimeloyl-ACP methyl ester carboxylesterase